MSNFKKLTKHPKTGQMKMATWIDDYFSTHKYGVRFNREEHVYPEDQIESGSPIVSPEQLVEAGKQVQIEQLATIRASEMIEEQRKKWLEEVRNQIPPLYDEISGPILYERGYREALRDVLSLPALQKGKND